jgi:Amt family ammonium transporter
MAGMAGMATWTAVEWFLRGKPTSLGLASGAIAGLATITPAAGFVTPNCAVIIGMLGGGLCYMAVLAKTRLGFDDSLDVVGIHGVGGLLGTLCLGVFASAAVNPAGADGLIHGNGGLLWAQLKGVAAVGMYTLAVSWILLKAIDALTPLRVGPAAEEEGLDTSQHSESAYQN